MKLYGVLSGTGDIHASYFYGDGSNLTGIAGGSSNHALLSNLAYASSGHIGFMPVIGGTFTGDVFFGAQNISGTGDIYAGNLYGDGSNLTNISGAAVDHSTLSNLDYASAGHTGFLPATSGTDIQNQLNAKMPLAGGIFTGDVFFGAQNISGTGNIYAGNFYGDGSNLTGVSGAGVSEHSSLTELDYAFAGHTGFLPATSGTDIQNQLNGKSATGHNHDGSYYTETELDNGQLDSRYYTESEVNTISGALSSEIDSDISTHASNANAHHAQSHTVVSHSDTTAEGSELNTLTDGSDAGALHIHDYLPISSGTDIQDQLDTKLENISGEDHSTLNNLDYASAGHTGFLPSTSGTDIQNQINTHVHDGRYYTETELDNGQLDNRYYTEGEINTISGALSDEIDSDISTHASNANAHHNESHTLVSHSDTSATGPELDTLTDGSDADSLHYHDFTNISGSLDHGSLSGLEDDDHTQYLLADGTRSLTNAWNYGANNISGTGDIYANAFYGDGSNLTNISGAAVNHATLSNLDYTSAGHTGFLPATSGTDIQNQLNTKVDWSYGANNISGTGDIYANAFYGDGSNLTNISGASVNHSTLSNLNYASSGHTGFLPATSGTDIQNQLNTKMPLAGGTFTGNVTWATGIDILAAVSGTSDIGTSSLPFQNIYVDNFYGDGSNLTGVSGVGVSAHSALTELDYVSSGHTDFLPATSGTDIQNQLNGKSTTGHNHDGSYYTETELDNGQLDNRYYTEGEVDTISGALSSEIDSDISTHTSNANAHHNESHTVASHSDTSGTGAELDTLTDGSNADVLHSHTTSVSGGDHSILTNLDYASAGHTGFLPATSGTDIQNQLNGKSATGHDHDTRYYTETELDNGQLDSRYYTEGEVNTISGALSSEIDSDISTHASNANVHHNQSHTVASHSDTDATGAELSTLTDGSSADVLHTHTTSVSGGDHASLTNLDYASSGHTGFLPATSGTDVQNQLNTKMPLAGGTFTGNVTYATGIDILAAASGTSDIGTPSLPFQSVYADTLYGSSLSLQEDITFTGATTDNIIEMPDNLADALSIKEGSNSYMQFITTDGDEDILFNKPVDIHHTAVMADDHAVEIDVNAATYGDVKALGINYITGNIITGRDEGVILVNIEETLATGGEVFALEVLSTDGSADGIHALKVGPVIHPIHQDSGVFVNPTLATDNTSGTDVLVMRDGILGNTTTIFEDQNEYIIIGYSSAYQDLELVFSTAATKNINPTFWYSTGGTGYTQFTPVDGTDGCKHTGVISWDASDLAGHVANATGTFDIKIIRTRNNMIAPVLGYAKTATTMEYIWDKNGNVSINSLAVAGNVTFATGTDILAITSGTNDIGTSSLPFQSIYADSFYGDGSNLTGISGAGVSAHSSLTELDYAFAGHTGFLPATSGTDIQNQLNGKSATGHNHDGSYYTETELDNGQLDSRYYTESEVNTISGALSSEIDSDISTHASNANAHHAQSHTVVSHSDTTAEGSELNTLTDGSDAGALHIHDYLPISSGTDIQDQLDTKLENISGEDHSTLNNLDYASAGHTDFMSTAGGTFTGDITLATGEHILAAASGTSNVGSASIPFGNVYCDDLRVDDNIYVEDVTTNEAATGGIVVTMTVDANTTGFGAALHMDTDGNWIEADAVVSGTMPCQAMALETGTGSKEVLMQGFVRDDSWAWTIGGNIYVGNTAGTLTQTTPNGSGEIVQAVGFATHADRMYFNPDYAFIEIA